MTGNTIGFVIWSIVGCFFICLGIYSCFSKRAIGFWANEEVFEVTNIKKYNTAMAKLFCAFFFYDKTLSIYWGFIFVYDMIVGKK